LAQHIFKQLTKYGRLSANQVAQRCRLLLRQAKAGLGTLVQLQLVQFHATGDGITTYQANLDNTYNLLRTGKLAHLAAQRCGSVAGVVVEVLISGGVTTVQELEEAATLALDAEAKAGRHLVNGTKTSAKVRDAIRRLADHEVLCRVRPVHLHIPYDARGDAEANFQQIALGGQKGEALRADRAQKIQAEMEKRLDTNLTGDIINAALTPYVDGAQVKPEEIVYLAPNYALVARTVRDSITTEHVAKTLGKASAKLLSALMKQIDPLSTPAAPSPNPRTEEQLLALSRIQEDSRHAQISNGIRQTNGYHDEDVEMTNGFEDHDYYEKEDLEDGLLTITRGPYPFLRRDEADSSWYFDRYKLSMWLKDQEVINLIKPRVGVVGMRLVRMLIDKGKLDERLLQERGLLAAKEMRQALAELQSMGFIQLQEVPREPQRQPNRTIFLWFYDSLGARNVLLGEVYKSMARVYQRLQLVERQRSKATLEKIERDDVKDRVEEVVLGQEMVELEQFRGKERWLMAELARLDDSVALLRDI
jgi:DNA-directed RNA polymerase III subunit RPC3